MGTPRIERQHRCPIRIAAMSSLAIAIAFGVMPATAAAYTISNELSDGCHERITADALRKVRQDSPTASPLPISDNDRALVDDLQFTPDDDMRDLGGATLLIAVRDNDLKGRPSDDLSALAEVHGNPDGQNEHCLRGADDKEPVARRPLSMPVARTFASEPRRRSRASTTEACPMATGAHR